MNEMLPSKDQYDIEDLLKIVSILRSEQGCPWDRAQDHHSLRNHFIEETYEAIEAIDREDKALLCEELGDVLLQIVFHCVLETENGGFSFDDICDGISKKMIFRHPHVFGEKSLSADETADDRWDKMKQREKRYSTAAEYLQQVSPALPALLRTEKLTGRAEKRGVAFPADELMNAISAEVHALQDRRKSGATGDRDQWGKLLFLIGAAATQQGIAPEEALERYNREFIEHFTRAEELAKERYGSLTDCDAEALNIIWLETENTNLSGE